MDPRLARGNYLNEADYLKGAAEALWETMDANERYGVKFGLFPARVMPEGDQRKLCVALMDLAK